MACVVVVDDDDGCSARQQQGISSGAHPHTPKTHTIIDWSQEEVVLVDERIPTLCDIYLE